MKENPYQAPSEVIKFPWHKLYFGTMFIISCAEFGVGLWGIHHGIYKSYLMTICVLVAMLASFSGYIDD